MDAPKCPVCVKTMQEIRRARLTYDTFGTVYYCAYCGREKTVADADTDKKQD